MPTALDNGIRRSQRGLRAAASAPVIVVAAACGGADELTGDEYVRKVAEIRGRAVAEERALDPPDTYQGEDFAKFVEETYRLRERMMSDLRELDAPESLKGDVNRWLALLDRQLVIGRQRFEALESGDSEESKKLAEESKSNAAQGQALGGKLGLHGCGPARVPGDAHRRRQRPALPSQAAPRRRRAAPRPEALAAAPRPPRTRDGWP
jgi:hypothetical protein